MTLNPHPLYPAVGCYILKLHRDADPRAGELFGRLEHFVSGEHADFSTAATLIDWLLEHACRARSGS